MPTAAPVPRGPTMLTLYTAADLLTGPGCPVCRYAGEASDRYLAWWALEGHADSVTVTRLCASLGMCARHTRGLMSQPGAARRLTALHRYLVRAARDRLAGRAARPGGCPACEHDDGAAGRALDTLLDGLADDLVRDRYRELGGLCIPHLRAASARGDHRLVAWLAQTMTAAVTARLPDPGWLAGTGHDADVRFVLRGALPASAPPGAGTCAACLATGRSEASHLARIARTSDRGRPDRRLLLCSGHLSDLIVLAGQQEAGSVLAWQAGSLAAALAGPVSPWGRKPGGPAGWLRSRRRRAAGPGGCPVCLAGQAAARQAVDDLRAALRAAHPVPVWQAPLCVRHLLDLKAADSWAGQVTARGAIERADLLIAELDQAFTNATWAHRHHATGPEMTAWRRAAVFLDGGVFCGCPPRGT
jgi:hypothetical protein